MGLPWRHSQPACGCMWMSAQRLGHAGTVELYRHKGKAEFDWGAMRVMLTITAEAHAGHGGQLHRSG